MAQDRGSACGPRIHSTRSGYPWSPKLAAFGQPVSHFGVSSTGRSPDGAVSNYWLLQCGKVQILIFNDIPTMADG